jgi:hypothetical protein
MFLFCGLPPQFSLAFFFFFFLFFHFLLPFHFAVLSTAMPSPSTTSAPLRFVPHASAVEVGFWHILARRKLNEWKLARGTVTFQGERRSAHEPAAVAWTEVAALALEALDGDGAAADAASAAPPSLRPGHFSVRVALDNFNTIEEFREVDRVAAAGDAARAIVAACSDLARPVDETLLSGCMLHTFADIKKLRGHFIYFYFNIFLFNW